MKRNRRLILCSLIILASVLFFSCGVPTICTLNNIKVKKGTYTQSTVSFSIEGTDSDLSMVSTSCPGLLVCYVANNSIAFSDSSTVTSAFKSKITNKVYIDYDNSILTYGNNNDKLYVFSKENGSRVLSPSYCMNLHGFISGTTMNAPLTLTHESGQQYTINTTTIYTSSDVVGYNQYLHVFAAFTADQGNFSNAYVSDLVYLGYITLAGI